jgi:hypothetical protein
MGEGHPCKCEIRDREAGKHYKKCRQCNVMDCRCFVMLISLFLLYVGEIFFFSSDLGKYILNDFLHFSLAFFFIAFLLFLPYLIFLLFNSPLYYDCEFYIYRNPRPKQICEYCVGRSERKSTKIICLAIGCRRIYDKIYKKKIN